MILDIALLVRGNVTLTQFNNILERMDECGISVYGIPDIRENGAYMHCIYHEDIGDIYGIIKEIPGLEIDTETMREWNE